MPRIEGTIEDVVFRNETNGWTVLSLKCGREHTSAVGTVGPMSVGETVAIEGEWVEHPDYGRQIRIESIEATRPNTLKGIERYLGSGIIKGVGPATAKLLVHHFGKDTLDVLDMAPDRVTEIAGIGPKRAEIIAKSYQEQREARQAMVFLQTYGLTPALAAKVYRVLGANTQALVRQNPYLLVDKVDGVGFKTADAIANSLGIERESIHRLGSGIRHVLSEAVNQEGHTYLPRELLLEKSNKLLGVSMELVEHALVAMTFDYRLIQKDGEDGATRVYLPALYDAEGDVANMLRIRMRGQDVKGIPKLDQKIDKFERNNDVTLCEQQRNAVHAASDGRLAIITGGPGTGKTTGIRCIIELLSEQMEVELCAPTGRAAKRMSEATGYPARTIHRMLEYAGEDGVFARNQDNPIGADALIVDEMSMVDIFLMRSLLRALKPNARLIMVGDADQLPSVGAGNVLRDLIASGVLPTVRLTEIFRQAAESMIVMNAHRILKGDPPSVNQKGTDFFMERTDTAVSAAQKVLALTSERLPKYMGLDSMRDIQVMAPMKKGEAGVISLNQLLQQQLNPAMRAKRELTREGATLREGDKVMQIRNNYELPWERDGEKGTGAFNGDIGFVESIDTEERSLMVRFDDDRLAEYTEAELEELELAYCMSVHKSQGSEFEAVVLPLISGPPMLYTRNLLYTAVTRARRLVVLVGRERCVMQMVNNNHIARRFSALGERLRSQPDELI
ncbi:ATP-dependent RecD-like DNA helicase [Eubacteriales bacterium OttesenSCG-928-N13]|nr:ATP-dependent RecD-like DNA helicase [Eubacteriales bacterium OttesenSCG-928-N13]